MKRFLLPFFVIMASLTNPSSAEPLTVTQSIEQMRTCESTLGNATQSLAADDSTMAMSGPGGIFACTLTCEAVCLVGGVASGGTIAAVCAAVAATGVGCSAACAMVLF